MNAKLRIVSMVIVASTAWLSAGCSVKSGWGTGTGESEGALTSNQKSAYDFFISQGLQPFQAAAIVGNLIQESSVNPSSYQYGGGPGRGIAQWSAGERWDKTPNDNVASFASARGLDKWSLDAQLQFIWYELTTFPTYGLADLQNATDVDTATVAFQDEFEVCGACDQSQRIAYAQQVLAAYGNGGGTSGSQGCYSSTYDQEVQNDVCIQSKYDGLWYECDNGDWVDRSSDPTPCNGEYPYQ